MGIRYETKREHQAMIKLAQRSLEKRYGFKPSLKAIILLETDYKGYVRFCVGDHEYRVVYERVDDVGTFPGRGGYTHV